MSTDKEKLNQLTAKVDELAALLNRTSEELRSVSSQLKTLSGGTTVQPASAAAVTAPPMSTSTPPHDTGAKQRSVDDIRMSFPEELEARLGFEDKGEFIIIKPKQFLGSENFAKIASAVRGMGGEYISAGKDSHFRVPKKKA